MKEGRLNLNPINQQTLGEPSKQPPADMSQPSAPPPYPNLGEPSYQPQLNQPVFQQPQPNVVYVAQNVYGPYPCHVTCPHCQCQVLTQTRPVAGLLAWLLCILLIIFGCGLGCCLIPFCIDGKEAKIFCFFKILSDLSNDSANAIAC
jgi:lipopolysaccharide-induced tumor necrosis factor-alpha factor